VAARYLSTQEKRPEENLATVSDPCPLDAGLCASAQQFQQARHPRSPSSTRTVDRGFLELVARLALGDDKSPTFVRFGPRTCRHRRRRQAGEVRATVQSAQGAHSRVAGSAGEDRSFRRPEWPTALVSAGRVDAGSFSVVNMIKEEFNIRRRADPHAREAQRGVSGRVIESAGTKRAKSSFLSANGPAAAVRVPEAGCARKHWSASSAGFPAAFAGGLGVRWATAARMAFVMPGTGRMIERIEFDLLERRWTSSEKGIAPSSRVWPKTRPSARAQGSAAGIQACPDVRGDGCAAGRWSPRPRWSYRLGE
jgi:hypothetical protein